MIFATLKDGTRDGTLVLVDRSRSRAVRATPIVPTMQQALDTWDAVMTPLKELSDALNDRRVGEAFDLDLTQLAAPLPRAYAFLDGSAYPEHMIPIRTVRGAKIPDDFFEKPLMYQGCSDLFIGPTDPILLREDDAYGVDIEAEIIVVTGDVPQGTTVAEAPAFVRLLGLLNDVSLRGLVPAEIGRTFGFLQSKSASTMGPFLVTPDEVGDLWNGRLLTGRYVCTIRDVVIGDLDPGQDAAFGYADLIAHASHTRELRAGTVIGAGALANKDRAHGCGCIAELRAREHLATGEPATPYLHFGDGLRLEYFDKSGTSVFGAIEQRLERWPGR